MAAQLGRSRALERTAPQVSPPGFHRNPGAVRGGDPCTASPSSSPTSTPRHARYLSSGAWTLGIIAVGCVLAPQITGTSKQEGLLDYQRTLPVARSAILLADAIVWNLAALPGIAVGMLAAAFRFGLDIHVDAVTVAVVLGVQFATVSIGYAVAFWLPLTATSLVTQVIMIGGLLFSPITFPAERLPEWASTLHQFLPFAPIGDLVREAAFRTGDAQLTNLLVIAAWTVLAYTTAYLALRKRN